jgi:hypothetical protein
MVSLNRQARLVPQELLYEHIREGERTVYFSLASSAISSYVFFSSGAISLHISPNFRPTSVNERPGFSSLIRFLTELLNTTNDVAGFLGPPCKSPRQRKMQRENFFVLVPSTDSSPPSWNSIVQQCSAPTSPSASSLGRLFVCIKIMGVWDQLCGTECIQAIR